MKGKKIYAFLAVAALLAVGCTHNKQEAPPLRANQPSSLNANSETPTPSATNTISDEEKEQLRQQLEELQAQANELEDMSTSATELDEDVQLKSE